MTASPVGQYLKKKNSFFSLNSKLKQRDSRILAKKGHFLLSYWKPTKSTNKKSFIMICFENVKSNIRWSNLVHFSEPAGATGNKEAFRSRRNSNSMDLYSADYSVRLSRKGSELSLQQKSACHIKVDDSNASKIKLCSRQVFSILFYQVSTVSTTA